LPAFHFQVGSPPFPFISLVATHHPKQNPPPPSFLVPIGDPIFSVPPVLPPGPRRGSFIEGLFVPSCFGPSGFSSIVMRRLLLEDPQPPPLLWSAPSFLQIKSLHRSPANTACVGFPRSPGFFLCSAVTGCGGSVGWYSAVCFFFFLRGPSFNTFFSCQSRLFVISRSVGAYRRSDFACLFAHLRWCGGRLF